MAEYSDLFASIEATTSDYRGGGLLTEDHIRRWVEQFDHSMRLQILREMDHILRKMYISKKRTKKFLINVLENADMDGGKPHAFWEGVKFLDIQKIGESQKKMLKMFNDELKGRCGLEIEDCGRDSDTFIYLDDGIFSGFRVRSDLENWIKNYSPANAKIKIITIVCYTYGKWHVEKKIKEFAKESGKDIDLEFFSHMVLENRLKCMRESDILRPTEIPKDKEVLDYVAELEQEVEKNKREYKMELTRAVGGGVGKNSIFLSEEGRHLLEREFLKVGVRILRDKKNLRGRQRPLGNMIFESFGFGALFLTFMNCPNNAPLALWVGDLKTGYPWYPLFPRISNTRNSV